MRWKQRRHIPYAVPRPISRSGNTDNGPRTVDIDGDMTPRLQRLAAGGCYTRPKDTVMEEKDKQKITLTDHSMMLMMEMVVPNANQLQGALLLMYSYENRYCTYGM